MPITGLAIAAGVSLLKDKLVDQPRADRQRKLAAATQRFSPWTHLTADPVKDPNPLGDALTAGVTGAMVGQGIENSQAQNAFLDRQGDLSGAASSAGADSGGDVGAGITAPEESARGKSVASPEIAKADPYGYAAPSIGAPPANGRTPAWFFGNPQKDAYASLADAGISPDAPSHFWGLKTNPWMQG